MGPGPRGKIKAAHDYLEVAPTVVAVARDIDLGSPDTTLPSTPADPEMVAQMAESSTSTGRSSASPPCWPAD